LAELIGTFILCTIGNGSVAQNIAQGASYLDINIAYGLGCAFGVYVSAGISGGHINPARSTKKYYFQKFSFTHSAPLARNLPKNWIFFDFLPY